MYFADRRASAGYGFQSGVDAIHMVGQIFLYVKTWFDKMSATIGKNPDLRCLILYNYCIYDPF